MRYICPFLFLFFNLLLCCFAQANEATVANKEKIRLQLRWHHQFQFAGYYAAKSKNYYQQSGLEVELVEGGAGINTIEEVLAGRADFGVTNSEILLHKLKGEPLVVLAAIFQHSPLVIVARQDRDIFNPQDLIGKRTILSRTSRDLELHAMLHEEDVQLEQLSISNKIANKKDYFDESIDAISAYITNQPYYYQLNNIPFSVLRPSSYGIDFYGDCLFTTQKFIEQHPELVRKFRESSLKGWRYAMQHPEEISSLLHLDYSTNKSIRHLQYEAEAMRKLIQPDLIEIGHMNPGRWQHIANIFVKYKMADANYSLDNFLYEEHVPNNQHPMLLFFFGSVAIFLSFIILTLFLFNKKLKKEIHERKLTEEALSLSQEEAQKYSKQLEQVSIAATSLLSIQNDPDLFSRIGEAIVEHTDYNKLSISIFRDESPFRVILSHQGFTDNDSAKALLDTSLTKSYFNLVFLAAEQISSSCYYVPHSIKYILDSQYADLETEGKEDVWHQNDTLLVKIVDEKKRFLGLITANNSKSGKRPSIEAVRPLQIFANLFAQVFILKRELHERQKLEEKLQQTKKMEAIDNLTGGIAHDFNNLLGIILGNAELIQLDNNSNGTLKKQADIIYNAADRGKEIVQQLLFFSYQKSEDFTHVDLNETIKETIRLIEPTLSDNILLYHSQQQDSPLSVLGSESQLHRVIINLCTNAIQAMEQSGGWLTLSTNKKGSPGSEYIELKVKDTGPGIEKKITQKIFDPYFTTKRQGKGTGLGLAIVHGIIKGHNGKITLTSQPGQGTTFIVQLPYYAHTDPLRPQDLPIKKKGERGKNILLVDDDEDLLTTVEQLLTRLSYQVTSFTNPYLAEEAFRANPALFDVVITDMYMPQILGSELAERLLDYHSDTPIILYSGHSDIIDIDTVREIGIKHYLKKPLNTEDLDEAIQKVLVS